MGDNWLLIGHLFARWRFNRKGHHLTGSDVIIEKRCHFLCVWFAKSQKMGSNKVEAVSIRSQAYILIKQGYSVRDTAQLIGK